MKEDVLYHLKPISKSDRFLEEMGAAFDLFTAIQVTEPTGNIITFDPISFNISQIEVFIGSEDDRECIDLMLWDKIAACTIDGKVLSKLDMPFIAAVLLWELTFYGTSPEAIEVQRERIFKVIEEIKNDSRYGTYEDAIEHQKKEEDET